MKNENTEKSKNIILQIQIRFKIHNKMMWIKIN